MRKKLAEVADVYYGKSPADVIDQDNDIPVIGTGGRYATANRSLYDVGIVVPRKGSLGSPQLVTTPFWPSDTTFAVVPRSKVDPSWLYFSLLNFDLTRLNEATGVPSISRDWLCKLSLVDPGHTQQIKIASILHTIDQAIERTSALIDKYQQIKAGLMHDLFTRGIGADGKLRPPREQAPELYQQTPIGWIPKDWNVMQLTSIAHYQHGRPFPSADYSDEGVYLLRPGNLHASGYVIFDEAHSTRIPHSWVEHARDYVLQNGDILMNLTAQSLDDDFLGRVCMCETIEPSLLNQRIARFKAVAVDHEFLYWILRSPLFRSQIDRTSQGTKVQHLYNRDLDRVLLGVPSAEEQIDISKILNNISKKIRGEIDQLRKARSAKAGLMHDLLTEKVSVTHCTAIKEAADVQN